MEVEPMAGPAQPPSEEPKKKIRSCPHCGQPMEIKNPWKALWRMPTLNEWLILFMMAMMVFAAWAYKHDVQICRDFIANGTTTCVGNFDQSNYTSFVSPNITLIISAINQSNSTLINDTIENTTIEINETNETINDLNNVSIINETT